MSRVAKALGDRTRLRLFAAIVARPEVSCAELTDRAALAQATVSHHLKVLADAGLVAVRREGAFHLYRSIPGALDAHARDLAALFPPPGRLSRRPIRSTKGATP